MDDAARAEVGSDLEHKAVAAGRERRAFQFRARETQKRKSGRTGEPNPAVGGVTGDQVHRIVGEKAIEQRPFCRGGIGRSPACAIALHLAHGTTMAEAIQLVVADRPQAQPNPLFVLVLDEVLGATGELWHDYHQWAYRQPWWISGLEPDPSRSASATRSALRAQTHRTRQQ